jgi:glycerol-3-phosphate dehydrogenase (NAD(P)+)
VTIAVLGTGQWGSALAQVLIDAGNDVLIWGRNKSVVAEITERHTNERSLPGHKLPNSLAATDDIQVALSSAATVVLSVPTQSLRANLMEWRGYFPRELPIISSLKGIEAGTLMRVSEVTVDVLGVSPEQIALITGPNLAKEVILRQPVGAVAAARQQEMADLTAHLFSAPYFRAYTSTDLIGCELAGAAKNVIALAVGIAIGMGFGENTQSLVITRGLSELTRLGIASGAQPLTFVGLAGVGDLLATCGSSLSRNRSFGEALGRFGSMDRANETVTTTVEGVATASSFVALASRLGIDVPIMRSVAAVVANTITPTEAMIQLMSIDTGAEIDQ